MLYKQWPCVTLPDDLELPPGETYDNQNILYPISFNSVPLLGIGSPVITHGSKQITLIVNCSQAGLANVDKFAYKIKNLGDTNINNKGTLFIRGWFIGT